MNPSVHLLIVSRSKISIAVKRLRQADDGLWRYIIYASLKAEGTRWTDEIGSGTAVIPSRIVMENCKGIDECGERGQKRSSTPKAGAPRGHNVFLLSPRRRARPSRRRQSRRPSSLSAVTLPVWTISDDSAGQSASGTTTRAIHSHVLTRH